MKQTKTGYQPISANSFTTAQVEKKTLLSKTSKVFLMGAVTMFFILLGLRWMDNNFYFRSPLLIQSPLVEKTETPAKTTPSLSPSPTSTPSPTVTPSKKKGVTSSGFSRRAYSGPIDINSVVKAIAKAESGNGTAPVGHHKYCEGIGKTNIYGYGNRQKFCFDNAEVAELTIYNWVVKRLDKGLSLNQALCEYNIGIKETNCDYISLIASL